jgi:hypothetical protein
LGQCIVDRALFEALLARRREKGRLLGLGQLWPW